MSCDLTCKEVGTQSSKPVTLGRLWMNLCIVLRTETAFSSHLRDNILQRRSLRSSSSDRQAGACHLVEVAGNWTSKNEKWQDIDLLIAAVQTHRCEGQEEGVRGGRGRGYRAFTSDRETRKKRKKGRFIPWFPWMNFCSTFIVHYEAINLFKLIKKWARLFAEVYGCKVLDWFSA